MKTIGIILVVIGILGIFLGSMMFGDIGLAAFIGAITAVVSGIGFIKIENSLSNTERMSK